MLIEDSSGNDEGFGNTAAGKGLLLPSGVLVPWLKTESALPAAGANIIAAATASAALSLDFMTVTPLDEPPQLPPASL